MTMAGKLYLVGTPIGNLGDMSARVAETLASVDFIAAEDTRVTVKLLNHLDIKKPLVSYYEHNRAESGAKIVSRILSGENCALCTDAGMPAISDPGEDLVALCAAERIQVVAVPGPSAVVCAVALSGLPSGRFTFEGFLSTVKKVRNEHLESLRTEKRTMVFYEAPHKLASTLGDMLKYFGDRRIALCREMTKLHEETQRMTLKEAAAYYTENSPRGEFVLVVEGAPEEEKPVSTIEEASEIAKSLRDGGMKPREAAKAASEKTGVAKSLIYDALTKM